MTYNDLFNEVAEKVYNQFDQKVKCTSLQEIDALCKTVKNSLEKKDTINKAIESINNIFVSFTDAGTEELSFICYRVFTFTNHLTFDYRSRNLLPFHLNAYDYFKRKNDKEGIILFGTYLVDAIMNFERDTTKAVGFLNDVLSVSKEIEGGKHELYETSLEESNIRHYAEELGDIIKIYQ